MLTVHDRALLSGVVPSSLLGTCSPRQALIALGNMTPVDTIATVMGEILMTWSRYERLVKQNNADFRQRLYVSGDSYVSTSTISSW